MKKLFTALFMLTMLAMFSTSCEPTSLTEDEQQSVIDPEKVCPPSDKNCNGIPDDEE